MDKQIIVQSSIEGRRYLRIISAMTGEKQYEALERIAKQEYERLMSKIQEEHDEA